ncbi:MAG: hypothetical protein OEW83_12110 [Acidimicrobiia bacterium]|nr:hypothetical protein [Acidimicrobiia bacterium]
MTIVATDGGRRRRRPSGEPPPLPRPIDAAMIGWLAGFGCFAVLWVWVFLSDDPARWITLRDLELMTPVVENRVGWLDRIMEATNRAGLYWATPTVGWATLAAALVTKRIRHAVILLGSLSATAMVMTATADGIRRPRPLGLTITGEWEGFAQPSRPVALLTVVLVAAGLTLAPPKLRRYWYATAAAALTAFGVAQIYTAVEHPTDTLAGATTGTAITIVMYRLFAPETAFPITYRTAKTAHLDITGPREAAIRRALRDQLTIDVHSIRPVNLASSSGSTPLLIEADDGETYFGKLYASTHLRSDRSYKLGRTLLYGQLEDETRYTSVRRLVQHEDYMLHVMQRVGVPCPAPHGIVEITPEREYLLVTDHLADATEISDADITEQVIDEALAVVGVLWKAGLAHRDIKPGNVMVQDGHIRMVDVSFAQVRPSPWRQAVDLANMMLVLALGSTPELVYRHARRHFTDEEISEAFAATRGVTMPSQLRRSLRGDGRRLLDEFRRLAPTRPPVAIQRWTLRRAGLTLGYGAIAVSVLAVLASGLSDIGLA